MQTDVSITKTLLAEYETIVFEAGGKEEPDWDRLAASLVTTGDWTPSGAEYLVSLARNYGGFMLRNALALAAALGIDDGEFGL